MRTVYYNLTYVFIHVCLYLSLLIFILQARIQFIGREVAPGASIYAIDGVIADLEYVVYIPYTIQSTNLIFYRLQIIFSVRVPITSTGAVITDGVTDGLNDVVDEVAMANPGFEFSTVQRFGKIG